MRRLEPGGGRQTCSGIHQRWEVCSLRSPVTLIHPQLHPNRLPTRTAHFSVDWKTENSVSNQHKVGKSMGSSSVCTSLDAKYECDNRPFPAPRLTGSTGPSAGIRLHVRPRWPSRTLGVGRGVRLEVAQRQLTCGTRGPSAGGGEDGSSSSAGRGSTWTSCRRPQPCNLVAGERPVALQQADQSG